MRKEEKTKQKTKTIKQKYGHTHTQKKLCVVPIKRSYLPSYKILIDRYDDLNFYTNIHVFSFRCC